MRRCDCWPSANDPNRSLFPASREVSDVSNNHGHHPNQALLDVRARSPRASPRRRRRGPGHAMGRRHGPVHRRLATAPAAMIIHAVHCTELGCDRPGNRWWTGWIGPRESTSSLSTIWRHITSRNAAAIHTSRCTSPPTATLRAGLARQLRSPRTYGEGKLILLSRVTRGAPLPGRVARGRSRQASCRRA
jgi:hypothetical protein